MAEILIGSGDTYINRVDPITGLYLGWVGPIEATKYEPKAKSTIKPVKSKSRDKYNNVLGSVGLLEPAEFSLTLREVTPDNLAMLFSGDVITSSQTAGAVTDEPKVIPKTGGLALDKQNLTSAAVVMANAAGASPTTTWLENTDFTVNRRLGLITVIAGSALATAVAAAVAPPSTAPGLPVFVDYAVAVLSTSRVRGNTQPRLRAWIKFDGMNQFNGRSFVSEVWQAVLTPSAGLDFLADEPADIPLSGSMETPAGKTEPFYFEYRS